MKVVGNQECTHGSLANVELAAYPEAQPLAVSGTAGAFRDWRRERDRAQSVVLVEFKQQAHYWRSMHARAKERVAKWQSRWRQVRRELPAAQQRIEPSWWRAGAVVPDCSK